MELNNQAKYDESIVTLEEIIADNSSTSLDKYYAYLNKALTYKRLFNYPEVLTNLDLALKEGVKTDKSDNIVTQNYVKEHVEIGIASLRMIIDAKKTVKHLKFDW